MTYLWPDNVQTKDVFVGMGTQWRVGMSGPIGLDYAAMPVVARALGVRRSDWADLLDGIRVMESAALELMHKDKSKS